MRLGGTELKVVHNVSITWRKLGILLEVDYDMLTAIEERMQGP